MGKECVDVVEPSRLNERLRPTALIQSVLVERVGVVEPRGLNKLRRALRKRVGVEGVCVVEPCRLDQPESGSQAVREERVGVVEPRGLSKADERRQTVRVEIVGVVESCRLDKLCRPDRKRVSVEGVGVVEPRRLDQGIAGQKRVCVERVAVVVA